MIDERGRQRIRDAELPGRRHADVPLRQEIGARQPQAARRRGQLGRRIAHQERMHAEPERQPRAS
ncbi:hypothetical protein QM261_19130, partial [Acinetobacter baumannii]|nr:hypothetical protein [Acinetobacter baumannii]